MSFLTRERPNGPQRRLDFELTNVTVLRGKPLFSPLTVTLRPGTFLIIVGPNGAGKSSLLGALSGTGVPMTGQVTYGSKPLVKMSARERAATLSFMTQQSTAPNELRVKDVVDIGSAASSGMGSVALRTVQALNQLDASHLSDRVCSQLSGGQRQLIQVARVIAQEAPIMVLDEPTSALDLGHQLKVMHALHNQAAMGHIVIVTVHDLTQALRWSNLTALIFDESVLVGAPTDIITPDLVRRAYGVETEVFQSPTGSPTLSMVRPKGLEPIFSQYEDLRDLNHQI